MTESCDRDRQGSGSELCPYPPLPRRPRLARLAWTCEAAVFRAWGRVDAVCPASLEALVEELRFSLTRQITIHTVW